MDRSHIVNLISTEYVKDETGQMMAQEVARTLFCSVSSISMTEMLDAGNAGLKPEYRITIFEPDYDGEQIVELDGVRYAIYRTWRGTNDMLELYVERKAGAR